MQMKEPSGAEHGGNEEMAKEEVTMAESPEQRGAFGPWIVAQEACCRQSRVQRVIWIFRWEHQRQTWVVIMENQRNRRRSLLQVIWWGVNGHAR